MAQKTLNPESGQLLKAHNRSKHEDSVAVDQPEIDRKEPGSFKLPHNNLTSKLSHTAQFTLGLWNTRGIHSTTAHHPKHRLISLLNCDGLLLNEQWTKFNFSNYSSYTVEDIITTTSKINTASHIKTSIKHTFSSFPSTNVIICNLTDFDIDLINIYIRPEPSYINDNTVTAVCDHIAKSYKPSVVYGHFNRLADIDDTLLCWHTASLSSNSVQLTRYLEARIRVLASFNVSSAEVSSPHST